MKDTTYCPICENKMSSYKRMLKCGDKISNYIIRTCTGLNHCINFYTDLATNKVDILKLSIAPDYTKYIIIDFYNNNSRILLFKNNIQKSFDVPQILTPDFPNLLSLKNKVNLYTLFF